MWVFRTPSVTVDMNPTYAAASRHRFGGLGRILLFLAFSASLAAAPAGTKHFDVPASDAESALKAFSAQAGVEIIFTAEATRNVRTNAVRGDFTPREAIDRMLSGTPLAISENSRTGALKIRRVDDPNESGAIRGDRPRTTSAAAATPRGATAATTAAAAPGITVPVRSATPDRGEDETIVLAPFTLSATSVGYGASNSMSSSRIATPLKEIPQSMSVVTSTFMEDAGIFDNRDALKYVAGAEPRTTNHQPGVTVIRGLQSNQLYIDGFKANLLPIDMSGFDRSEVIKGPASAAVGRGEPAGLINHVRKMPLNVSRNTARVVVGNYDFFRASLDSTGPVTRDGRLAYRLNLAYQNNDTWKDLEHVERTAVYPSLRWNVGRDTTLVLHSTFLNHNGPASANSEWWNLRQGRRIGDIISNRRTPVPENLLVPAEHSESEPGAYRNYDFYDTMLIATHAFDSFAFLRFGVRGEDYREKFLWVRDSQAIVIWQNNGLGDDGRPWNGRGPAPQPNDLVLRNREVRIQNNGDEALRAQGDFLFKYNFLRASHQTLAGFELLAANSTNYQEIFFGGDANLTRPYYGGPQREGVLALRGRYGQDQGVNVRSDSHTAHHSYFFQHESELFRNTVKLIGGWRWDTQDSRNRNLLRNTQSDPPSDRTNAPRAAALIRVRPWLNLYALYSRQEDPATTATRYTNLPPSDPRSDARISAQRIGVVREFGLKSELLGGRMNVNLDWYELTRNGAILSGPGPQLYDDRGNALPTTFAQERFVGGGELSQGVELEVWGTAFERLSFLASGMYLTKQREPSPFNDAAGRTIILDVLTGFAKWQLKTFAKYDFRSHPERGFQAKVGAQLLGPIELHPRYVRDPLESQVVYDAGLSYTRGTFTVDLQVNNVLNERFIMAMNSEYSKRQILCSLTRRF